MCSVGEQPWVWQDGQNPLPRPPLPTASLELGTARVIPGQSCSALSSGSTGTTGKGPGKGGKRAWEGPPGLGVSQEGMVAPHSVRDMGTPELVTPRTGSWTQFPLTSVLLGLPKGQHREIGPSGCLALCTSGTHWHKGCDKCPGKGARLGGTRGSVWDKAPHALVLPAPTAGFPGGGDSQGLLETPGHLLVCLEPRASRTRGAAGPGEPQPPASSVLWHRAGGCFGAMHRGCNTTVAQFKRFYWK